MLKLTKEAENAIVSEKKAIAELKVKLKNLPPRDFVRGQMTKELYMHEKALVQAGQTAEYYRVRQEQRKEYAQKSYMEAFNADKPWPDPKEYAEYKKRKKLREVSLNWNDRVPKNTRYQKNAAIPKKSKEKKAAEKEPGEPKPAH